MPSETEHHVGDVAGLEPELPLSVDGIVRYVWHSRFGDMLIESIDGRVFVNGDVVNAMPVNPASD